MNSSPGTTTLRSPWGVTHASQNSQNSSTERYFTKSSEEQWLFRPAVGTPLMFRNRRYPSATAALDAYISEYDNKPRSVHQKYDEDLLQLLAPQDAGHSFSSKARADVIEGALRGSTGQWNRSNVQKLAEINQIVDDSYGRLEQASSALNDSARAMRAVDRDPLPSPSDLAVPARRFDSQSTITTDQLLMANPLGLTHGVPPHKTLHNHSSYGHIPGYLSTSQLQGIRSKVLNNYGVDDLPGKHALSPEDRFSSRSLDSLLDQQEVDSYHKSSQFQYKANFVSLSSSGPSSIQPNSTYQGSLGAKGSSGARQPPSWVNDLEDSDASSIVTGHFQNGLVSKHHGTKMASTPKHHHSATSRPGRNRQQKLHFESRDSTVDLELRDLQNSSVNRSRFSSSYSHTSAKPTMFNQHQYHPNSAKSCLKPVSFAPQTSGLKVSESRVSFADDTQLPSQYYSRASIAPTSRSRSRSHSVGAKTEGEKHSSLSSMTDNLVSYPAFGNKPKTVMTRSFDSTLPSSQPKIKNASPFVPRSREQVTSNTATSGHGFKDIQNPDHRKFLQRLMTEIEKSSSSIITETSPPDQPLVGQGTVMDEFLARHEHPIVKRQLFDGRAARSVSDEGLSQTVEWGSDAASSVNGQGPGYLARIRQLISPTKTGIHQGEPPTSPATDTLLDGDRPWEQHPTIKPPIYIGEKQSLSPDLLRKYKQACMMSDSPVTLDQTLTSGAQPGSLEALKQMLFSMQNLTDADVDTATNDDTLPGNVILDTSGNVNHTADKVADESQSMSPSTRKLLADTQQPGGESLNRAMQHLQRLKYLVENDGQQKQTTPSH